MSRIAAHISFVLGFVILIIYSSDSNFKIFYEYVFFKNDGYEFDGSKYDNSPSNIIRASILDNNISINTKEFSHILKLIKNSPNFSPPQIGPLYIDLIFLKTNQDTLVIDGGHDLLRFKSFVESSLENLLEFNIYTSIEVININHTDNTQMSQYVEINIDTDRYSIREHNIPEMLLHLVNVKKEYSKSCIFCKHITFFLYEVMNDKSILIKESLKSEKSSVDHVDNDLNLGGFISHEYSIAFMPFSSSASSSSLSISSSSRNQSNAECEPSSLSESVLFNYRKQIKDFYGLNFNIYSKNLSSNYVFNEQEIFVLTISWMDELHDLILRKIIILQDQIKHDFYPLQFKKLLSIKISNIIGHFESAHKTISGNFFTLNRNETSNLRLLIEPFRKLQKAYHLVRELETNNTIGYRKYYSWEQLLVIYSPYVIPVIFPLIRFNL